MYVVNTQIRFMKSGLSGALERVLDQTSRQVQQSCAPLSTL